MSGLGIVVAAAVLSIDVGWQPVAGGGYEYIIQIEPEALESLRAGEDIFSQLPPVMRSGIRSYRITVGDGPVPNQGRIPPAVDATAAGLPLGAEFPRGGEMPTAASAIPPARSESVNTTAPPPATKTEMTPRTAPAEGATVGYDAPIVADEAGPSALSSADQTALLNGTDTSADAAARPWPLLTAVLVALFASLGANAYLSWIAKSQRSRYRSLVARTAAG
jgi:hypothetical protein